MRRSRTARLIFCSARAAAPRGVAAWFLTDMIPDVSTGRVELDR